MLRSSFHVVYVYVMSCRMYLHQIIHLVFNIRPTCCITSTAKNGSRNVTRDINHVNNTFIFLICDFIVAQGIAVGREVGHVLQSRAYQKTAETVCVQPAFLRD
jgi:hypothetical protein